MGESKGRKQPFDVSDIKILEALKDYIYNVADDDALAYLAQVCFGCAVEPQDGRFVVYPTKEYYGGLGWAEDYVQTHNIDEALKVYKERLDWHQERIKLDAAKDANNKE